MRDFRSSEYLVVKFGAIRFEFGIEMNEFTPPIVPVLPQKRLTAESEQLDSVSKNLIKTRVEEYKLTHRALPLYSA